MKKFAALLLALCLLLTLTTAVAETRTFVLAGVTDADNNTIVSDELPVLVFGLNDETMECAFGDENEQVAGVAEIIGQEDRAVILNVVLEDGTEVQVVYIADEDACVYVDENGYIYTMIRVEE